MANTLDEIWKKKLYQSSDYREVGGVFTYYLFSSIFYALRHTILSDYFYKLFTFLCQFFRQLCSSFGSIFLWNFDFSPASSEKKKTNLPL